MYSQIILKQSVWGPYNRSGPYNGCFSESIAGSCLSGSSHWYSFPVGNCLCRHWVLLSTLATDCQCWKVICIFKYQGSRHMKNKSWAQKSTEMVELIRSWSQIMSIPVDLERARLPVASAITAGCVWWSEPRALFPDHRRYFENDENERARLYVYGAGRRWKLYRRAQGYWKRAYS